MPNSKIIAFPRPPRRPFVPTIVGKVPSDIAPAPVDAETVTFQHAFRLPGLEVAHAAGTFEVRHQREALDVSWPAWRITTTILLSDGAAVEALDVRAADLAAALDLDIAKTPVA